MTKAIDKNITMIRIDPFTKNVAQIRKQIGGNNAAVIRQIRQLVKAPGNPDLRKLLDIEEVRLTMDGHDPKTREPIKIDHGPTPLLVAAPGATEDGSTGWRLLGCEDTHGIGLLFGQGVNGGIVNCPVSLDWVRQRVRWVPAETDAEIADRALAYLHRYGSAFTDSEAARALVTAEDQGPFQAGDSVLWIPADFSATIGTQLLNDDMTDGPSGGRRLTRFGAAVRDALIENEK